MPLTPHDRDTLIRRYGEGPARLRAALAAVPGPALQWRPAPGAWSAHEVVCHCADSETNAYARIRYLTAEPEPLVLDYNEAQWAVTFDYHAHPLDLALATVDAVRASTLALLRRLPESAWTRVGRHTASGRYGAEDWLRIYAAHLEDHAVCSTGPTGGALMATCEVCGNDYDKAFEIVAPAGERHIFDSFECAIHRMAPTCEHCGCKVVGHGLEAHGQFFCCASCARMAGETGLKDRAA